jgi:NAD dependent epimerase/dehydratase family
MSTETVKLSGGPNPRLRPTTTSSAAMREYYETSKLAKYPFEPYWPQEKLKICITGAGGFIASHLAKRLKSEGHYIVACDWKRNEHMEVCMS